MLKVTHAVSLHLCNRCKSTWEINQSLLCKCPLLHFGYLRIWDLLQPLQHATLYLKIPKRKQLDFSTYILPFSKHTTSSSMLIQNTQHTPFCWDCCIAFVVVYKLISCLSNLSAITYSSSPVTFSVFYFLFTQSGFCSNGVCRQCSIKAITILFIILYLIVRFLKGFIFFASAVKGSLIHPISGWKCTDRQLNRTIWTPCFHGRLSCADRQHLQAHRDSPLIYMPGMKAADIKCKATAPCPWTLATQSP